VVGEGFRRLPLAAFTLFSPNLRESGVNTAFYAFEIALTVENRRRRNFYDAGFHFSLLTFHF
jgi:hypothetical protein